MNDNTFPHLDKEQLFSRLELANADGKPAFIYVFVEFEEHECDIKVDFPVGSMTIIKGDLSNSPIYTA